MVTVNFSLSMTLGRNSTTCLKKEKLQYAFALAIHLNAVFVTADELYYRKAETMGCIQLLSDWR